MHDMCCSGRALSNMVIRIVHENKSGQEIYGHTSAERAIQILDGHIRSLCGLGARRRLLQISVHEVPPTQPSFGSTPTAPVRPWSTQYEPNGCGLTRGRGSLIQRSSEGGMEKVCPREGVRTFRGRFGTKLIVLAFSIPSQVMYKYAC